MNNIQHTNSFSTNFKATPNEIKSIEKACKNLLKNDSLNHIKKESIDVAELGNKAYISTIQKGKRSMVKIELQDSNGANTYTLINTKSPKDTKNFLQLPNNINKIADVLDSLKEALARITEREF